MRQITVMVVDDSAVAREIVSELLSHDPAVKSVVAVADPIYAMQRMSTQWPDVIVLDVEMPRMDGITFLKRIMEERPTPVVICSTLTAHGAETTIQALAAGAFAVVAKPRLGMKELTPDASGNLLEVVKAAAQARISRMHGEDGDAPLPSPQLPLPRHALAETSRRVVAIGTSTGGTLALERVLSALPGLCPGVVVVQHMLEEHTRAFAARLDTVCRIDVREARHGDMVTPGLALIAPGGRHMQLNRSGARYRIEVSDGPRVGHHRPSVDVLFRSVARNAGPNALGVIMTGMGADGAQGLLEMREAGARTIAQDEESCVVFGMPREAIRRGGAESVMSLDSIAARIAAQEWPALPSPTP